MSTFRKRVRADSDFRMGGEKKKKRRPRVTDLSAGRRLASASTSRHSTGPRQTAQVAVDLAYDKSDCHESAVFRPHAAMALYNSARSFFGRDPTMSISSSSNTADAFFTVTSKTNFNSARSLVSAYCESVPFSSGSISARTSAAQRFIKVRD